MPLVLTEPRDYSLKLNIKASAILDDLLRRSVIDIPTFHNLSWTIADCWEDEEFVRAFLAPWEHWSVASPVNKHYVLSYLIGFTRTTDTHPGKEIIRGLQIAGIQGESLRSTQELIDTLDPEFTKEVRHALIRHLSSMRDKSHFTTGSYVLALGEAYL